MFDGVDDVIIGVVGYKSLYGLDVIARRFLAVDHGSVAGTQYLFPGTIKFTSLMMASIGAGRQVLMNTVRLAQCTEYG